MLSIKKAAIKPTWFDWGDGFEVQVQDIGQQKRDYLVEKNKRKDETDWTKFGKELVMLSVTGWKGLTNRILLQVCKAIELDPSANLDEEIEFSQENLKDLIENASPTFNAFLIKSIGKLPEVHNQLVAQELENLSHASGIKIAPKGLTTDN